MLELALTLAPFLLTLGAGGTIAKALLRIPIVGRWFSALFHSLPLGREEVQKLNRNRRYSPHEKP